MPTDFKYIIQELLHERVDDSNKAAYVNGIIETIISTGRADDFIVAICNVIQRLAIDQLHILGDIYDRGPGAHVIMDTMERYHSWDIPVGQSRYALDGSGCRQRGMYLQCDTSVVTLCQPHHARRRLWHQPCAACNFCNGNLWRHSIVRSFVPKSSGESMKLDEKAMRLTALMHKAIAVIQFKVEAQLFEKHPHWQMTDRAVLRHIDYTKGVITLDGKEYQLTSNEFPTIDPNSPLELTPEEKMLAKRLRHSFKVSEKLQRHVRLLLQHGCMYAIYNNNLLFHASVPLNMMQRLKKWRCFLGRPFRDESLCTTLACLFAPPTKRMPSRRARVCH